MKITRFSLLALLLHASLLIVAQGLPTVGLVAYYPFSGNPGDSSGNGNHGTLGSSAPVLTADRKGQANKAYYFNGNTNIITVPSSASLRPTNTLSLSVWIRSESKTASAWNMIMTCRYGPTAPYDSYKLSTFPTSGYNNRWTFGLGNQSTMTQKELIGKRVKQDNVWMHIAATYDGATMKFYTNGVLDTSLNFIIPNIAYSTTALAIGNSIVGAVDGFLGAIDELRIYNRALSDYEVALLAEAPIQYYSKSTGSLSALSTWGMNTDGSGASPVSFDSSNVVYNVVNGNTSLVGDWRVNGTNSTIVFGDGTNAATIAIGASDTVYADSMYVNNSMTLTVSGGLHSNKLGSGTGSSVQYISSTAQQLAKGTYENLIVSSSTKIMSGNAIVRGVLGMLASINTNGNELTLGTSTSVRGTLNRTAGNIIGRFSRWFTNATNTGTTGLFPIGTATLYAPYTIEYTTAPTAGGKITCEYVAGAPGNNGLPQFDFTSGLVFIDKVAVEGLVRVTNTGVSGGSYTSTFTANNYTGVTNYSNLRLVYRTVAGNWTVVGTAGTNTGTNTSANVIRSGLSTLAGEYGIGGDQSQNPLPVKLLSFTARMKSEQEALLEWKTAFEVNAARFIIERSTDLQTWEPQGTVAARGFSSSTVSYQYTNNITGLSGTVYYRLVEVTTDGKRMSSDVVSVYVKLIPKATIVLYPNPANEQIQVSGLNGTATMYDITGKPMGEIKRDGSYNIAHLPSGIYFLRTSTQVVKFVKQ